MSGQCIRPPSGIHYGSTVGRHVIPSTSYLNQEILNILQDNVSVRWEMMTNGKQSPSDVLAFLAETLQDSPQETPYSQTLASLHELYNKLAESFLLPSAFPEKIMCSNE